MSIFEVHPFFEMIVGLGCVGSAIFMWVFQTITSAEGMPGFEPNLSLGFAATFNFAEAGLVFFFKSTLAQKVKNTIQSKIFDNSSNQLVKVFEGVFDALTLAVVGGIYFFDCYTSRQGALRRGYSPAIATSLAGIQLFMFELLGTIGLWLIHDSVIRMRALNEELERGRELAS